LSLDPGPVEARERVLLSCEAPDDELLLAEWLNPLVYEMATRRMLFARFRAHRRTSAHRRGVW